MAARCLRGILPEQQQMTAPVHPEASVATHAEPAHVAVPVLAIDERRDGAHLLASIEEVAGQGEPLLVGLHLEHLARGERVQQPVVEGAEPLQRPQVGLPGARPETSEHVLVLGEIDPKQDRRALLAPHDVRVADLHRLISATGFGGVRPSSETRKVTS
jgi:hypothetical protein